MNGGINTVAFSQEISKPKAQEGVGFEEHLGKQIPLDVVFNDEEGNEVQLSDFFQDKKPVLLNFAYHTCPMLCHLVLEGITETLKNVDWTPGNEFEIITVSIAPTEDSALAKKQKAKYLDKLGKEGAAQGWHFLTGKEDNIKRLTTAAGFNYKWDEETQQYSHAAGILLVSPEGKITRYFYGIRYKTTDIKAGLYEAADGKVGETLEKIFLWCFQYDPNANSYTFSAFRAMQIGGGLFALLVIVVLTLFWRKEFNKREFTLET